MIEGVLTAGVAGGGTISGDLTITGDLTVQGTTTSVVDQAVSGTITIDVDDAEALLVRKDGDAGDVLVVDTVSESVGVGVTDPNSNESFSKLTTGGTENVNAIVTSLENAGTAQVGFVVRRDGGTTSRWYTYIPSGSADLRFHNVSDLVTFDSSGNVGIGTTSPAQMLHVDDTTTGGRILVDRSDLVRYLDLQANGVTGGGFVQGNPHLTLFSAAEIRFWTGSDETMRLHSSGGLSIGDDYVATDPGVDNVIIEGNVGIGTTSPTGKLQVESSTLNDDLLVLYNTNVAAAASVPVFMANKSGGSTTNVSIENAEGKLLLRTGATTIAGYGTTRYQIDANGLQTATVVLDEATGDEAALSLNYTTNKATSGNDTGLVINQTDTASPGTSLLLDCQVGGTSKFNVDNRGATVISVGSNAAFNVLELTGQPVSGNALLKTTGDTSGHAGTLLAEFSGTFNANTAIDQTMVAITPTISQSVTAGYTALKINVTESSTGSGAKMLLDCQVGGSSKFNIDVTNSRLNVDMDLQFTGPQTIKTSAGALTLQVSSVIYSDTTNIEVGTTTGTKIGTATGQKIGFWNATPVVQQAHIADPSGGATQDAEARTAINSINALLATLGLTAAA